MKAVSFVLPAGGSGRRMGGDLPKPFLELAGQPVLFHTLQRLRALTEVVEIVLVLPQDGFGRLVSKYGKALADAGVSKMVPGAASRQASVANGLAALEKESELIAIHDAVRPFPGAAMMRAVSAAAATHGGALPVLPVTDTIKRVAGEVILETVPRADLVAVQTPQIFQRELLLTAYQKAGALGEEITDDAAIVEAAGGKVVGVQGERFNMKITTPEDLRLAEVLLASGIVVMEESSGG